MKTTEIPAIIDEAKAAGCENADQINGYLAAEVSKLREALLPFSKIRDTVPLYIMPNLPDCKITAQLPAQAWQAAKAAVG